MNLKARSWFIMMAVAALFVLAACGGGSSGGGAGGPISIGSDGENLAYAPKTLTAKAGSPVTVNFKNNSSSQKHNWVLVKGGDDVASKVDEGAMSAGDAGGYLPADKANVVANTKMLDGNASDTVTFTAPAAGTYTFICTYPGHYAAGMKGTMTVAP